MENCSKTLDVGNNNWLGFLHMHFIGKLELLNFKFLNNIFTIKEEKNMASPFIFTSMLEFHIKDCLF